jgi:hypothetical protein
MVLGAATVAVWGVLRLRWLTQIIADDPISTIERAIVLRDQKTRSLAIAIVLFITGFGLYCSAVAALLLTA